MTIDDVYTFLYGWINQVLNTEMALAIPIIESNQNAPRPAVPYFVIHKPPISNIDLGLGDRGLWEFTDEPEDEGEVCSSKNWQASISLEEIGGSGTTMQYLVDSLIREDILDLFRNAKISLSRNEAITPTTDVTQNFIEKRAIMDVFMLYVSTITYDPGYVGTAEGTGTYN